MNFGQLRNTAPELRVNDWIDAMASRWTSRFDFRI